MAKILRDETQNEEMKEDQKKKKKVYSEVTKWRLKRNLMKKTRNEENKG